MTAPARVRGFPLDSYTPTNFQQLEDQDTDLGSVSLVILQPPAGSTIAHLGMQTGKDAKLRLINLDDMSGTGAPAHVGGESQLLDVPQGGGRHARAAGDLGRRQAARDMALRRQRQRHLGPDSSASTARTCRSCTSVWQNRGLDDLARSSRTASSTASARARGGTCIVARDPAERHRALVERARIGARTGRARSSSMASSTRSTTHRSSGRFGLGTPPVTHTVTPTAGANGSIAPSTPQTVNDGSTTVFTVTPDAHYRIADVTGCGGSLDGNTYTTGPITADCTVTATFAISRTR